MTPNRFHRGLLWSAAVLVAMPAAAAAQTQPAPDRIATYFDAATGLTIDQLVAMAIERAPAVAAAAARVDAATGERTQASLRPNPIAAVERTDRSSSVDGLTRIGIALPLDLFRRDARVEVADHAIQTASLMRDDAIRERAAMVRERTAGVLAALRQLGVAAEWSRFAKTRLDLLTARVDSGAARPLDRDLADVEWRRAETDVVAWQAAVDRELASLRAAVGLEAGAPLKLAAPLEDAAMSLPGPPAASVADAVAARPDVRALESEVRQAEAEGTLASKEGRLDLSVSAAYMNRTMATPTGGTHANEFMVGVMVDLPWRNRQQGRVAAAEGRRRAAEQTLAAGRLDAAADIDAARVRDAAAQRTVSLYRDGLMDTAARNLTVVRDSFDLGRGTLFDVINEERRYLELQTAFTAALREAIDARAELLRALGVAS